MDEADGRDQARSDRPMRPVIVVHGGAGVPAPQALEPTQRAAALAGLRAALAAGHQVLSVGGGALDAVEAAVRVLEDDPAFNAGIGAVLNRDGDAELDAAIMDGATGLAGAVAAVRRIRNPVSLAREVMSASPHAMLAGEGAERFARERGIGWVDPGIFATDRRREALRRVLAAQAGMPGARVRPTDAADRHGTVGAVAFDSAGHVAAATSTGGTTGKLPGRVGDSPVIGAGTYAADSACAVSATGHGESFLRVVFAHRVASLVTLAGRTLDEALARALAEVAAIGGDGGAIAVDARGATALAFNSAGMYRGVWRVGDAVPQVAIH